MPKAKDDSLAARYPNIQAWVFGGGWIEIGPEPNAGSFAGALDEGGMVFEGRSEYGSLEEALHDLDRGIGRWTREHG